MRSNTNLLVSHRRILNMRLQFLNRERRVLAMEHGMAVRADRPEVNHRIDLVFASDRGQRNQMVRVNKTHAKLAKFHFEGKTTDGTGRSAMINAGTQRFRMSRVR